MDTVFLLIVFLPLIGALVAGLGGTLALKTIGSAAEAPHGAGDGHHHHYDGPRWPALISIAFYARYRIDERRHDEIRRLLDERARSATSG